MRSLSGSYFLRRLLLTALVVAIPLLALRAYELAHKRQREEAAAVAQVAERSERAAREIDAVLDRTGRLLAFLSDRDELRAQDGARCATLIAGLTHVDPMLVNIGVVDLEGRPLCRAVTSAAAYPSYASVAWFREALAARDGLLLSRPYVGEISRRRLVNVVQPLLDRDGHRLGFIAAALDVDAIAGRSLSSDHLPPGSVLALVGDDGTIVAASREVAGWDGAPAAGRILPPAGPRSTGSALPAPATSTPAERGIDASNVATGPDGVERVVATTSLQHFGLRLGAGVPVAEVATASRRGFVRGVLGILAAALVGFVTAAILARRLGEPLRRLAASARAVGEGRPVQADERLPQEFGLLAREFNRMVAARRVAEEARHAQVEAEAANRAKTEFLATMSHEIRTPLNAMIGLTALTLRTPLTPRQQDYLEKAEGAARSLLELVDDVLDIAKVEAGRLELEHVVFDLGETLRRVSQIVGDRARQKGLAFEVDVAPGLPARLVGDGHRLGQVLVNLAGNAVKFTERGEVRLTVAPEPVAPDAPDGRVAVRFEVRDTGIGMSEAQRERLFQPFTQADVSTSRRFGGTGLGLAISQQLVQLMQGRISVRSTPGQGSVFTFAVPFGTVVEAGAAVEALTASGLGAMPGPVAAVEDVGVEPLSAPTSSPAAWTESPDARHVLVVEDNALNQLVATEMLATLPGVAVTVAGSGAEALERVRERRYDLVLMDIQMPGMDGYEATRRLRADPAQAGLPIVAVTANATPRDRELARAAGMDDYITKPYEASALAALVSRWAGGGRADDAALMDPARGIRLCAGREATYRRILARFVESRPNAAEALRAAWDHGDRATAGRLAHSLISSAALVGSERLSEEARALSLSIGDGDEAAAVRGLAAVERLHARTTAEAVVWLAAHAGDRPVDPGVARQP
jgi:signal transduction histidine kinase/FixJ family two-component response regulator